VDDIDEAIIPRYIAMIKYHAPQCANRKKIWEIMTTQFGLPLSAVLIEQLADIFPKATGRDIKGLTKLVAKFCQQKQLEPDLVVF